MKVSDNIKMAASWSVVGIVIWFCSTSDFLESDFNANAYESPTTSVVAPAAPVAVKPSNEDRMACIRRYYDTSEYQSCMEDVADVFKSGPMLDAGLEMCWEHYGKYEPAPNCG